MDLFNDEPQADRFEQPELIGSHGPGYVGAVAELREKMERARQAARLRPGDARLAERAKVAELDYTRAAQTLGKIGHRELSLSVELGK